MDTTLVIYILTESWRFLWDTPSPQSLRIKFLFIVTDRQRFCVSEHMEDVPERLVSVWSYTKKVDFPRNLYHGELRKSMFGNLKLLIFFPV